MSRKLIIGLSVITLAISLLIYSAVTAVAKEVVTVESLTAGGRPQTNVRLGARVSEAQIDYQTNPKFLLKFGVHGIADSTKRIPVVFHGVMPDTLKVGRDVILEGNFDGQEFQAEQLMTQCPSKYEPPLPK